MVRTTLGIVAACALLGHAGAAAPTPGAAAYEARVRPFLARHCQACHGATKPKGDFRIDTLSRDFASRDNRERWLAALKRVQSGEMPPKARPRPPGKDVEALASWVRDQAARRAGRTVLRRLNRVEYENTVRDLLGIDIDLKELLPPDTSAHGFDNNAEALHVSSFLMERYLEAADRALGVAIANGPQPKLVKKRYSLKDERHVKHTTERVFRRLDDGLVFFSSSPWQSVTLGQFWPPDRGRYRFRISASGVQSGGAPVTYRVDAGLMLMAGKTHLVGYFDAPADKPAVVEFVDHLEARNTIRILPYGLASAQAVHKEGADAYKGPGLAVQWVEVEGPLHETWPSVSHRRLFGDLPQAPVPGVRGRVEVVSKRPLADAERLLRDFARRAFRRAVTDGDVRPLVDLVKDRLAEGRTFEQAVRAGFKGVLVSPDFLFLREKPGRLDDFALASRLSYFLWSTMPDEELLALGEKKQLGEPATLRRQVERLLRHPKAAAFTENFVGQWLGLRDIDFTVPDRRLYPEFDDMLKVAMVREAQLFFDEVLRGDLSLTNFVTSDFTMLNERLAKHYGIPGVKGHHHRKVTLPPNSHRGGVLTMAAVLKVTANGTTTSPVVRGAWVLDRVLGTPPAPPPAGVPAVEPDIRGATTIREQLARHREVASCAACHAKIDPAGFALESFDVIGGWREHYRTVGRGKPVTVDGRRMPYLQGPKVDPADVLPDGRKFRDIDELKQLLLKDRDQLARALCEKLLTYATGAAPEAADRADIDAIIRKVRDRDYGLRTLVHEVVQSELFRCK
jgi:mono/diheme cytochrome c family protein